MLCRDGVMLDAVLIQDVIGPSDLLYGKSQVILKVNCSFIQESRPLKQ